MTERDPNDDCPRKDDPNVLHTFLPATDRSPSSRRGLLAVALGFALISGCGGDAANLDGSSISTVPAKGTITAAGKPVTQGIVVIEPLLDGGSTNQATGEIKSDGTFVLRSSASSEGAMPGKYRVKVESDQVKIKKGKDIPEVTVEVKSGQDLTIALP